jgi:glycosyltransferase involved in cell wall biosynthesis
MPRAVRLSVIGSGPAESELKTLVKQLGLDCVRFVGFVDQTELPRHYADADAFIFPTLGDTFGIALLEAAASGLALVASCEAGATGDFVQGSDVGWVFDPEDEVSLAGQIASLASDHSQVVRMGKAAFEMARNRTPDRTAEAYMSAINFVLAARE